MRWLLAVILVLASASCAAPGETPATQATVTQPAAGTPLLAETQTPAATATHTPIPAVIATPTYTPAQPATQTPAHRPLVAIISIDGLRPDALLQAEAPNMLGLAQRGAFTWQAQTTFPPATLPAHASMLSGQAPEVHGVDWNDYVPERGFISVPTIFTLAQDAGLRTAAVVGKEKMIQLFEPGALDEYVFATSGDRDVADHAVELAAEGYDLLFIHLPNMDYFGHLEGWMSPTYLSQLTRTDAAVGRILAALPERPLVILTSDHGGTDMAHGSRSPADMTIPWIVAGPGVRAGHEIAGPVSVADTAATAAHVLGLSLPAGSAGQVVTDAFDGATAQATPAPPGLAEMLAGTWSQGATQHPARSEMPAAVLDGLIYVPGGFGGETVFQAYDPERDAWLDLAPLPEGRHHLMAAAHGGQVYVFGGAAAGGWTPTATTFVYDPASDSWTEAAPMPEARMSGAAVALGERLYVAGGVGATSALLEYDPVTNTWRSLAEVRQPREHVAAAALDGEIYAIGGRWSVVGELSSVEIYDPATDTWRPGPELPRPMAGFNAAVLHGRILAAGGEMIMRGRETLTTFAIYDPAAQSWSLGPDLPEPLHGVPAAAVDGRFYVLGGSSLAGAVENQGRVYIYTP
jgi:N-acetylneuraminic acid mutarotase